MNSAYRYLRLSTNEEASPVWRTTDETWQPLVCLSESQNQIIVRDFCQWIDQLSARHGSDCRAWWYTWLASRDQLNCRILSWWRELYALEQLLDRHAKNSVSLEVQLSDPLLLPTSRLLGKRYGYIMKRRILHQLAYCNRRLRTHSTYLGQWLKFLAYSGISKVLGLRIPSTRLTGKRPIVLLVTIFHGHEFGDQTYRDTYLGELSWGLNANGIDTLTTGFCYSKPRQVLTDLIASGCQDIHPFGKGLSLRTLLKVGYSVLTFPLHLRLSHPHYPAFALWEAVADAWMYGIALLGEATLNMLIREHHPLKVVQMFENNPWERCIAFAAKDNLQHIYRFGFHHCAIIPFHLKNRLSSVEIEAGLVPEQVISTGSRATQVLATLCPPGTTISTGCDLRSLSPPEPTSDAITTPSTVLVVLEGLWKAMELVALILQYLDHHPTEYICIRAHPVLALDTLLSRLGAVDSLPPNLRVSQNSLATDLGQAVVIIYQGSTVAMTAATHRIPLLHFAGTVYPTDNPLFQVPQIKSFSNTSQLHKLLSNLSAGNLYSQASLDAIKDYACQYLTPPSSKELARLCNLISQ